jgi:hypothetical protein
VPDHPFGAGPFFLVENVPLENVLSRGEPAEFAHHSAFGYCGGGAIELMLFEMVRGAAAGWDGSEPLRPVES